uniref:Uncharacterized protein n=1 Tax=Arundo donax TaxID=35708 RepID=A0A0A9DQV5_ARUDO
MFKFLLFLLLGKILLIFLTMKIISQILLHLHSWKWEIRLIYHESKQMRAALLEEPTQAIWNLRLFCLNHNGVHCLGGMRASQKELHSSVTFCKIHGLLGSDHTLLQRKWLMRKSQLQVSREKIVKGATPR